MKTYPKVKAVEVKEDWQLLVTFDNGTRKLYDCKPLLDTEAFEALSHDWMFKLVKVDPGGYGISWGDDIDLSESELWENARPIEPEDSTKG